MLGFPAFSFAFVAVSPRPTGRSSQETGSGGVKGTLKESLRLEYAPLGEEPGRNSCCGVGFSTCEKVQKITSSADASKAAPLARSNSPAYRWTSPG